MKKKKIAIPFYVLSRDYYRDRGGGDLWNYCKNIFAVVRSYFFSIFYIYTLLSLSNPVNYLVRKKICPFLPFVNDQDFRGKRHLVYGKKKKYIGIDGSICCNNFCHFVNQCCFFKSCYWYFLFFWLAFKYMIFPDLVGEYFHRHNNF